MMMKFQLRSLARSLQRMLVAVSDARQTRKATTTPTRTTLAP
jgi:hypothetical protein